MVWQKNQVCRVQPAFVLFHFYQLDLKKPSCKFELPLAPLPTIHVNPFLFNRTLFAFFYSL
jgi:hypothetical protein